MSFYEEGDQTINSARACERKSSCWGLQRLLLFKYLDKLNTTARLQLNDDMIDSWYESELLKTSSLEAFKEAVDHPLK